MVEGFGLKCSTETIPPYIKTKIQVELESIVVAS